MPPSLPTRFRAGPAGGLIVKLVFLSILVGAFLSMLGLTPPDLVQGLRNLASRLFSMGFGAVREVVRYFVYGAVIVVPIWLLSRLLGGGRG